MDKMKKKWVMVPAEPTVEMIAALGFDGDVELAVGHGAISVSLATAYSNMLDAAPQPPALGGDVEVLGYISKSALADLEAGLHVPACITSGTKSRTNQHPGPDYIREVPIYDETHVARLQAEVERNEAYVRGQRKSLDVCAEQIEALQKRAAELEGLLSDIEKRHWSVEFDLPADLIARIKALAEGAQS